MGKTLVFGHKSPDTDTICASLVMANLQKKLGNEAEAVRNGEINKETTYVLNYLNVESPRLIEGVEKDQEVILVDHNEFGQSANNIAEAKIKMVVDHHRVCDFKTAEPLYYRAEPVGCTCTILYKMYKENGIEIDKTMASLMLSAIYSDTLLLKSPTKTAEDERVVAELEAISGLDKDNYGIAMLKAGTDLSDVTAKRLIEIDCKECPLNDKKAKVAQVNTVDIPKMMERKEEIEEVMKADIEANGLDLFVFAITDVLKSNSQVIVLGKETALFEKAFKKELVDNTVLLEGVVSRKKQILPPLQNNA